ncbi:phytanoyl-CoA dioxygenase family protein [Chloroflexi bacterium TSY]|nr:phytanoyl-CoA dioxygenase family protein [Chloroflexi bacterium TSY]
MHFTNEQIEHYQTYGHVHGPRVLSDEQITTLKAHIDAILDGSHPFPEHLMGETVKKSSAKGQLPSVKVVNLFRHDRVFAELIKNEAISALARDLMAGPVRLWEDQMIYKPPFDEKAMLAWHQDYTYWDQVGPAELGTCWIALDDATIENGCMHVIPGSHRWPLKYAREDVDASDPHWLFKQRGIPEDANLTPIPCEVAAGHCHFHHCRTFHGSYGNKTGNPRRSYIMHLMPGYTRRLGNNWNARQGDVEIVEVGEVLKGSIYPELISV